MALVRGTKLGAKEPSGASNDGTRIATSSGAFDKKAPTPREAFDAAFDLAAAAAGCTTLDALVVAVVDRFRAVVGLVCIEPGQAITVGRHSECPIRLREEDISLRHLAIHHARDSVGSVVRIWDLNTGRPFRTEDGATAEAVTAEGPLMATLGRYAIACLPCDAVDWKAGATAAWEALPDRAISGRLAEGTGIREPFDRGPRRPQVTRTGRAEALTDAGDPETAVAELIIDSPAGRRRFHISAEHLERGVLVGRYDRCGAGGVDDSAVSRVHLLIAATAGGIHAIDTASTNGTHTPAGAFLARPLDDKATLRLARHTYLRWRRRIGGQA